MQQLAIHPRNEEGKFSTLSLHIVTEKINGVERGATWLLRKARVLGPQTGRWSESMIAERGVAGVRVLQGLLALAQKHHRDEIEQACEVAWSHQEYLLRTMRKLHERSSSRQKTFEFLDEHPFIRPMAEYGELVRSAFHKGIHHA